MRMYTIFTVTMVSGLINIPKTRSVGFTHEFETADEIVKINDLDIAENGYYEYAVIEETPPYITVIGSRNQWWYKYNATTNTFEPIPKPEQFKSIVGWALG